MTDLGTATGEDFWRAAFEKAMARAEAAEADARQQRERAERAESTIGTLDAVEWKIESSRAWLVAHQAKEKLMTWDADLAWLISRWETKGPLNPAQELREFRAALGRA